MIELWDMIFDYHVECVIGLKNLVEILSYELAIFIVCLFGSIPIFKFMTE